MLVQWSIHKTLTAIGAQCGLSSTSDHGTLGEPATLSGLSFIICKIRMLDQMVFEVFPALTSTVQ